MSFDSNVKLSLVMTDKFHNWVSSFAKDDSGYLDKLYEVALSYLLGEGNESNWNDTYYLDMGITSPLFISYLKELDMKMSQSEYAPDWGFPESNSNVIDFPKERVENAILKLKQTGDIFYFYAMMLVYFGGFSIYHHTHQAIPFYQKDLKVYMEYLKVYVTARKMEKEFSREDVLKATKFAESSEPINPEEFPIYLLEGTGVVRKNGKYYVTEDVLKSITAAGGMAQALERQDLEGGVENAAPKQGRTGEVDDGADGEDKKSSNNANS